MNDLILTPKRLKKELVIYLGALLSAIFLNVYAILSYKTSFTELWSEMPFVLLLSLVFYAAIGLFRIIWLGFRNFF